jgi:hypothetical protein
LSRAPGTKLSTCGYARFATTAPVRAVVPLRVRAGRLALAAIWSLWRARVRPGWFMPAVAAALVVGTVVSLANTPIT